MTNLRCPSTAFQSLRCGFERSCYDNNLLLRLANEFKQMFRRAQVGVAPSNEERVYRIG